jgi:hypothetical protein
MKNMVDALLVAPLPALVMWAESNVLLLQTIKP